MNDKYKRPNRLTGLPFESGFEDIDGRVFFGYLNKQGNDGYYLEEWKRDMKSYLKKIERTKS